MFLCSSYMGPSGGNYGVISSRIKRRASSHFEMEISECEFPSCQNVFILIYKKNKWFELKLASTAVKNHQRQQARQCSRRHPEAGTVTKHIALLVGV